MTEKITQMRWVQLKGLTRWALTALLSCASLFFLYSGFVTGLIAAGGQLNEARRLWEYQAIVRLSLAMLLWFAAVLAFLFLRRGGIGTILRGDQISAPKRWFYMVILAVSTIAAFLAIVEVMSKGFNG